ncbi:hypothetical protein DL96DRAFT_1702983 [Flagelloscypha sp. PMI_526]|nr:hypothetical protein DL96DRAFT_1702983 [Flagelloscypha sp. PMI_526]
MASKVQPIVSYETLPSELVNHILHFTCLRSDAKPVLFACSSASRLWCSLAQPYLFSTVDLAHKNPDTAIANKKSLRKAILFKRSLTARPLLGTYVKSLAIRPITGIPYDFWSIYSSLKSIEGLTLDFAGSSAVALPAGTKRQLTHLLWPKLTSLHLKRVRPVPLLSFLPSTSNLRHLTLENCLTSRDSTLSRAPPSFPSLSLRGYGGWEYSRGDIIRFFNDSISQIKPNLASLSLGPEFCSHLFRSRVGSTVFSRVFTSVSTRPPVGKFLDLTSVPRLERLQISLPAHDGKPEELNIWQFHSPFFLLFGEVLGSQSKVSICPNLLEITFIMDPNPIYHKSFIRGKEFEVSISWASFDEILNDKLRLPRFQRLIFEGESKLLKDFDIVFSLLPRSLPLKRCLW